MFGLLKYAARCKGHSDDMFCLLFVIVAKPSRAPDSSNRRNKFARSSPLGWSLNGYTFTSPPNFNARPEPGIPPQWETYQALQHRSRPELS